MKVAVYVAEPSPPKASGFFSKISDVIRTNTHYFRDSARFSRRSQRTDYRNYLTATSVNCGDIAIAKAIELILRERTPDITLQFIRWSDLEKHKPDWDSFIIGGSGYIFLDKSGNTSSRLSEDIDYFIRNNINSILFGIGVNLPLALSTSLVSIENHQLLSAATEDNLRKLLSIARNISVRDFTTKEVLSRYTNKPVANDW